MDRDVVLSELASGALDHLLDTVKAHLQLLHSRAVADADKVVARAVEQIATLRRVEVEEDARHHDCLLLQQGVEEGQAVADVDGRVLGQRRLQRRQVQPDVEGGFGSVLVALAEADFVEALEDVVAFLRFRFLVRNDSIDHKTTLRNTYRFEVGL